MKMHSVGLLLVLATSTASAATPATSFYAVGHADDWQLFMNPNAYNDVQDVDSRTVIIHTTAGDAGNGAGNAGRSQPYYLAREEGALRALRFMKSANGNTGQQQLQREVRSINGHPIVRYDSVDGRAVMYFMRLPDGGGGGAGFVGTGNESIEKLKTAGKPIHAVDGSANYVSWADFTSALATLVRTEAAGSAGVWFNLADTDVGLNPGDHSDHRFTSQAMQEARASLSSCINQAFFVGYDTQNRPENVLGNNLLIKAATWGATGSGISDMDHANSFDTGHNQWLPRSYSRVLMGTGNCAL
jgi:hypothetical protein